MSDWNDRIIEECGSASLVCLARRGTPEPVPIPLLEAIAR